MSDTGLISGKFYHASSLLKPYIVALGDARSRGGTTERRDEVQSLLDVLVPMSQHLRDASYFDLHIDWEKISEFPCSRHGADWPAARDGTVALASRLEKSCDSRVNLSGDDMSTLGGVALVLGRKCSCPHRKMRGRRMSDICGTRSAIRLRCHIRKGQNRARSKACVPGRAMPRARPPEGQVRLPRCPFPTPTARWNAHTVEAGTSGRHSAGQYSVHGTAQRQDPASGDRRPPALGGMPFATLLADMSANRKC